MHRPISRKLAPASRVPAAAFIAAFVAAAATASAQEPMARVDVKPDGSPAIGRSVEWYPHPLAAGGRVIAFASGSDDLVAGDVNGFDDIFVRDLATATTVRVSVSSQEAEANQSSYAPSISGDGRFVAFTSSASNLVAVDTNNVIDVFLRDRDPGGDGSFDESDATTVCISRKTNGAQSDQHSQFPSIAADGSYVAFESGSSLDGVSRSGTQVFGYDVATGALACLSGAPDGSDPGGESRRPSVSDDGLRIAFQGDGPWIVASDRNGNTDIFLRDRVAGVTTLVSLGVDGQQGDDDCYQPALSGDGNFVVFTTDADNLFPNDKNEDPDVLLRDLVAGTTELISRADDGTQGDRTSWRPCVSGDGRFVAFESDAWNLLPQDQNQRSDVMLLDRASGVLELISETCVGFAANQESSRPAISADGRLVSFFSRASDLLPDLVGGDHVYLRDRDVAWPEASHRIFGAGWPGTHGVPSLDVGADPEFGSTFTVTAGNSSGAWNVGFLLIGFDETSLPTNLGGTLLVDLVLVQTIVLPPFGWSVAVDAGLDPSFCGFEFDVQLIQVDPGASAGFSFTPGLELIWGR